VQSFIIKHAGKINGILECFDRVILRGHLPIAAPGYFSTWLYSKQIALNLKDPPEGWWNFKAAAPALAEKLKAHAKALAAAAGRPYTHLPAHERMEDNARAMVEKEGLGSGLVCI
jgi:hypothetical protein